MKIIFLGVGEAFDENQPNNSLIVSTGKTNLLLDCGYGVPYQLWKYNPDQNFLDAIYISHNHADHYFGLPALLLRMWEEKREKPITIIGQKGFKELFDNLLDIYAYPGFSEKFNFERKIIEINEAEKIQFNDLELSFAPTIHSGKNLAIKVVNDKKTICYSGDGIFNEKTKKLYKNSDLVVQEAYLYDEKKIGHACVKKSIEMAERNNVKCLSLNHLNRFFRRSDLEDLKKKISGSKVKVIIPEAFEEYNL